MEAMQAKAKVVVVVVVAMAVVSERAKAHRLRNVR